MSMLPIDKLEQLSRRYTELDDLLCQQDVLSDRTKLSKLNKERSEIEPVVNEFRRYRDLERKLREAEEALADPELRELAALEISDLNLERGNLERSIQVLLIPPDPDERQHTDGERGLGARGHGLEAGAEVGGCGKRGGLDRGGGWVGHGSAGGVPGGPAGGATPKGQPARSGR